MFKWERFLRKKINKNIRYNNFEDREFADGLQDYDLNSGDMAYESGEGDKKADEYEVVEIEILPAKIICPDCGGITLEGLEFCDKCGGEL